MKIQMLSMIYDSEVPLALSIYKLLNKISAMHELAISLGSGLSFKFCWLMDSLGSLRVVQFI